MITHSTYKSSLTGALVSLLSLFVVMYGGLQSGKAWLWSGCAISCAIGYDILFWGF